uniref:TLC domain-containing protein n=1 Tax=Arcella intermedia TaxID=1963864 RepID=A0A6B2LHQ3_9EUKA
MGILTVANQDWAFSPTKYWEAGATTLTSPIYTYYVIELAHYFYATLTLKNEPKQKDIIVMGLHHVISILLISGSLYYGHVRIGVCVMLTTDICDPILELAKISKYNGKQKIADVIFGLFAVLWFLTRIVTFPIKFTQPAILYCPCSTSCPILIGLFCILQVLFFYWTYMIMKIALKVKKGEGAADTRDDD